MCPKDSDGVANSQDPDHTQEIWVSIVYPEISENEKKNDNIRYHLNSSLFQ